MQVVLEYIWEHRHDYFSLWDCAVQKLLENVFNGHWCDVDYRIKNKNVNKGKQQYAVNFCVPPKYNYLLNRKRDREMAQVENITDTVDRLSYKWIKGSNWLSDSTMMWKPSGKEEARNVCKSKEYASLGSVWKYVYRVSGA